jgi:D-aminoacyl-tRNA deacylase
VRALAQRVTHAEVRVAGEVTGSIEHGLLVLLGVGHEDGADEARWIGDKLAALRVFADEAGRMNRSVRDVGGSVLLVSQFTLYADVLRGNRPSFVAAADPERARPLVDAVAAQLRASGLRVAEGVFGAAMAVASVNDGPVTIWIDTDARGG